MSQLRRKFRLINSEYSDMDLTIYEQEIVNAVNSVVPGKNPEVYKDHFSTDPLTQSEAVALGRALVKIDGLKDCGKEVKTYRLFEGKNYASEEASKPMVKKIIHKKQER